jgi:septal ring factor EnvC (AmiA/AmiB activator)
MAPKGLDMPSGESKSKAKAQQPALPDVGGLSVAHTSMFFAVLSDMQRSFGRVEAKVEALGTRIDSVEESIKSLRGEIKDLRDETHRDIKELRDETQRDSKELRQETRELHGRIDYIWSWVKYGAGFAAAVFVFASLPDAARAFLISLISK